MPTTFTYTFANEDSLTELGILREQQNNVLVIAGSGARVIPLFAKMPKHMTCIDMSQNQLYLTELRIESLRQLNYDEYRILLGYLNAKPDLRKLTFEKVKFSEPAKQFMTRYFESIDWGSLLFSGKWEIDLAKTSKIFKTILPNLGQQLNDCETLDQQQLLYVDIKSKLNIIRLLLFISLLVLSAKNRLKFQRTHISFKGMMSLIFEFNRTLKRVFATFLIKNSFYYSILFTEQYFSHLAPTAEVDKKLFEHYKKGALQCNVRYVHKDVLDYCETSSSKYDFLSLSNVPDYLKSSAKINFLRHLKGAVQKQGILTYRRSVTDNFDEKSPSVNEVTDEYQHIISRDMTPYYRVFVYEY